jgi:hypothetical protein
MTSNLCFKYFAAEIILSSTTILIFLNSKMPELVKDPTLEKLLQKNCVWLQACMVNGQDQQRSFDTNVKNQSGSYYGHPS